MANIKLRGKLIPVDKTTVTDLEYLFEDKAATSKVIQVGEDGRPIFYDVNNYISEQLKQQSEADKKYAEQKAKEEAAAAQTAAEAKAAEEALAAKNAAISTAADDATTKATNALESAKTAIKEVSDELASTKTTLSTDIKNAKDAADKANTDLATEIARAKAEEEGITNNLTEHGTLINKNKDDISTLSVQSDKITAEVFDTTGAGKVSKLEQTASSISTELTDLTKDGGRISAVEQKADSISSTVTDLTKDGGRISTVEQTANKVSSAVFNGDTNRISTLEQTSTNITSRVGTIETWKDTEAATKAFVNSSIASNTGSLKGNFDVINDLGLTYTSTNSEIAAALLTKTADASTNDYCFVDTKEDETACIKRFKYSGTEWLFEYKLNNSSFTETQWAAINSGIIADNVAVLKADHSAIGEWDISQGTISGKVGSISEQIVTINSDTSDLKTKYETQASEISTITQTDGTIDLKVSAAKTEIQTEIDATNSTVSTLSNKVSTNETNITANKNAIDLKASKTDVDNLTGRVTTAEGNITTMQGEISSKAESTEVTNLSAKVTTAESNISSLQGSIATKVETTEYNKTVDALGEVQTTVESHTSALEQTAQDISAKVSSVSAGALNAVGWSLKSDGFNITSNNNEVFKVDTSGNLEVTGKVTATSGAIGGCDITGGLLSVPAARISGTLNANQIDSEALKTKKLEVKSSSDTIFYADVDKPASTQIGGFTVNNKALYTGITSFPIGAPSVAGVYLGTDGIIIGNSTDYFKIDKDGNTSLTGSIKTLLKGDKGDTGEQGPVGETGPKGDTGEQGPEGPQGAAGKTIENGVLYFKQNSSTSPAFEYTTKAAAIAADWSISPITPSSEYQYTFKCNYTITDDVFSHETVELDASCDSLISILSTDDVNIIAKDTATNKYYLKADNINGTLSDKVTIAGFTVGTNAITSGTGDDSMSIGPEKISLGNGKFIGNKNGNLLVTDAYLGKQVVFNDDAIFLPYSYNETTGTCEGYFELDEKEDLVFTFADNSSYTLVVADKMCPTTANDYNMSSKDSLVGKSEGKYTLYCHRVYLKNATEDAYIGEVVFKCEIIANAKSLDKAELCPIIVTAIKTDFVNNKQYQVTKNSHIADNTQILANTSGITQESNGIVVSNDAISFDTNNKLDPAGVRVVDSNGNSQLVSWTALPGSFGHFVYNDLGNWSCNYTLAETAIKLGDFAKIELTYNASNKITSLSGYPIPATLSGYSIKSMFADTNVLKDELFGLFPSTVSIYYNSGYTLSIEGKVKGNFGFDSLPVLPTAPLIIPLTYSDGFGGWTQTGNIKIPSSGEATTLKGTVIGFSSTDSTTDTATGAFYFAVAIPKNYGYEYLTTFTGTLGGSVITFNIAESDLDPASDTVYISQKLLQMFNIKIYSASTTAMSAQGTYTVTLDSFVNYKPTAAATSSTAQGTSLELSVTIPGGVLD